MAISSSLYDFVAIRIPDQRDSKWAGTQHIAFSLAIRFVSGHASR